MRKTTLWLAILLLALPSLCSADSFSLTDTTSDVPGTAYTLTINSLGGLSYSAALTANTVDFTPTSWFIDWIQLHLDGGSNPNASSLSVFNLTTDPGMTSPLANWNIADKVDQPAVNVQGPSPSSSFTIPVNGNIAFYVSGILFPASNITQGALLNGNSYHWAFDFSLANGTTLNPTPSLQVGYYDGLRNRNGTIAYTRLSQEFQRVSEPGSLAFVGMGLIVAAVLSRRKRFPRGS